MRRIGALLQKLNGPEVQKPNRLATHLWNAVSSSAFICAKAENAQRPRRRWSLNSSGWADCWRKIPITLKIPLEGRRDGASL